MSDEQTAAPETSSPAPEGAKERPPAEPWLAPAWGEAVRALVLFCLLGMAVVVTLRLSFGQDWAYDFLKRNRIEMADRMMLIYQVIAAGAVAVMPPLAVMFFRRDGALLAQRFERWAWFVSPFILLPAIPVVLRHEIWKGQHERLLPILLFGGVIAELFLTKAAQHVPLAVARLFDRFWNEEPEEKSETPRVLAWIDRHLALLVVVTAALLYGAFMSYFTVRWHQKLGTATFDLGINDNLLFGGLHGKFNQSTVIFPEDPQKYLANHVKIGIYTFLPLYALFPRAETLLVIQSVSLGLGSIPLFLFARRRLPRWWAAALALAYLAYYPMHGANFYEMKLVPTAAAIVLTCIYAIDAKRWVMAWLFFFWALIMREDLPVPLAVVGAVFLLSGHRPKMGLAVCAISTTWFILLRFRLMNEVGAWWFPNMYRDLWARPERGFTGVIKTVLSNPSFTLSQIFVEKKFWYMMHLLVPLLFLPVRRWWGWAALVPGAILTLLVTDYDPPIMFSFQYVMHWSPYLFIAAAVVLADRLKGPEGLSRGFGAVVAMSLVSLALTFNYGAFPRRDEALKSGYHKIEFSFSEEERARLADLRSLVRRLPPDATVGSTERIGPHVSARVGFYTLRRGDHDVEYMLAQKKGLNLDKTRRTLSQALESGRYGVVATAGDFVLFQRGADPSGNEAIIEEWKLSKSRSKKSKRLKKRRAKDAEENDDIDEDEADDEIGEAEAGEDIDEDETDDDETDDDGDAGNEDPQPASKGLGDGEPSSVGSGR